MRLDTNRSISQIHYFSHEIIVIKWHTFWVTIGSHQEQQHLQKYDFMFLVKFHITDVLGLIFFVFDCQTASLAYGLCY